MNCELVGVFAFRTAIDALRAKLDIVKRPIAVGIVEYLAEAQVVGLVAIEIFGCQNAAQRTKLAHGIVATTGMPAVWAFHVSTVMHGLVVGNILFLIFRIGHGANGRVTSPYAKVDGDSAGFVLQINLNHTTLLTRSVTQTNLIGTRGNGRQFECHVEYTTDTDCVCLIGMPVVHVTMHSNKGFLTAFPVGNVAVLETRKNVLTIAATAVTVHEVGTKHGSINTYATVKHLIAYLCCVSQDVIEIVVDTIQRVLIGRTRFRG